MAKLSSCLLLLALIVSCDRENFKQGEWLYLNKCGNCHMEEGLGLKQLIPPVAGADWVKDNQDKLACIIRYGMEGPVTVNGEEYNQIMPGVPELTDTEVTNIINYINHSWGNDYGYRKFKEVRQALEGCKR